MKPAVLLAAFALASAGLVVCPPGAAQAAVAEAAAQSRVLTVAKGKSAAFHLDSPAAEMVVAQPEIAEIVATTDQSFYVRGKSFGGTNILVYGPGKRLREVIDVKVGFDLDALRGDIAEMFPNEKLQVRNLADGLVLTGEASDNGVAHRVKALAELYAPKAVTSNLTVRASEQVVLEVRFIEASRRSLKEFGFNLQAANHSTFAFASGSGLLSGQASAGQLNVVGRVGTGYLSVTLDALESKGLIHTLAEPNLVALSGESASFMAGGEFPVPIPQGLNNVTLEFRPFGVKLDFLPTLLDNSMVRLKVAPEVSQLDPSHSVHISGFDVPALSVRKAATTVELSDGESLAIAGLFQRGYANAVRQVPGAGSLPILGALFRSSQWQKDESELVIIITPHVAKGPLPVANPTDGDREPSAIDLILQGILDDQLKAEHGEGKKG